MTDPKTTPRPSTAFSILKPKPKYSGYTLELGSRTFHWEVGIESHFINHARLMTEAGRLDDFAIEARELLLLIPPSNLKTDGKRHTILKDGKYAGFYKVSEFTMEEL